MDHILKLNDPHSNRVQSSCITVGTLHEANLAIDNTDEILKWEHLMKALTIEFSLSEISAHVYITSL